MIGGLNTKLFRSAFVYYKTLNQKYKNVYIKIYKMQELFDKWVDYKNDSQ